MSRGPLIAVRDCLTEITVLYDITARMTPDAFRDDPVARRAAAYAIQTISEAVRRHEYYPLDDRILWEIMTSDASVLKSVLESMLARHLKENNG